MQKGGRQNLCEIEKIHKVEVSTLNAEIARLKRENEELKNTKEETQSPYVLLIEEINRANVAAVFGDVFQLLDRKNGVSEYPIATSEDIKAFFHFRVHYSIFLFIIL